MAFRDNSFANPTGLVRYVGEQRSFAKVRPDMRVVFLRESEDVGQRLKVTNRIVRELVGIAGGSSASALA